MESPALLVGSMDFDNMTDEELDKYFASCEPLSNLPTPPPTKDSLFADVVIANSIPQPGILPQALELEAYATQLANFVPPNVSTSRPATLTIRSFLERANLPVEVVAFSACILDALSQRFATSWRAACAPAASVHFHGMSQFRQHPNVFPEVVVLAALALAEDFLQDRSRSNKHWAQIEARGLFTAREIQITKTCILQDMDYGLLRITQEMVQHMMRTMQRGTKVSSSAACTKSSAAIEKDERRPKLSLDLPGTAVWNYGMQTPEPSP
ncbi:hypothetical protein BDV96DRAFT_663169 [Lophiotrema nucula]|uniref:Cyclin N-terminal domain-containing protein n=1 Tax=Lophiotrema nucula TaxID=690887 RepID=A0A6A5ZV16_9PLEO|nr:hypothetical protein BDV96DRAFT_663169 [Lophiotrema nucula]